MGAFSMYGNEAAFDDVMRKIPLTHLIQDTTAVAVGLAATLVADAFTEINVILLCVVAGLSLVDVVAGMWRVLVREGRAALCWAKFMRGLGRKIGYAAYWIAAGVTDMLTSLTPSFGPSIGALTPVTKLVLLAIAVREIVSIAGHAEQITGFGLPRDIIRRQAQQLVEQEADDS